MDNFQTIIFLMFAAAILVGIAQKIRIPYPIALVIGGTAMGFVPGLPAINYDPNMILKIVLPPILYYAAFGTSFREFKRNWKEIFSLALGLVFVTTLVVGVIFKFLFPEFPWALAFAFGAIVAPPDAVAAISILKRFAIGPRLLAVLEGESLINDASALVLYRVAVTALLSGVFSLADASFEFVKVVSGGILIGVITGLAFQWFSRRFLDPIVGVVFSFTIPYNTFALADYLEVSGVLAVVVNGLIGSKILLKHHSSLRRVLGFATWDIFIILMNCFVFILIGLQLRTLSLTMTTQEMWEYTGYGFAITLAMILVRMVWVYAKSGFSYVKALQDPKTQSQCVNILREAPLLWWSGMRGIVSLTAALALPLTLQDGSPLHGRNEVIYLTFVVILLTLIVPGFTLPLLIRWLRINYQEEIPGLHNIRNELAKTAREKVLELLEDKSINQEEFDFLSKYFKLQRKILQISSTDQKELHNLEMSRSIVLRAQRKRLQDLWDNNEIDDKLFNRLEHELDVEETHVARAELK